MTRRGGRGGRLGGMTMASVEVAHAPTNQHRVTTVSINTTCDPCIFPLSLYYTQSSRVSVALACFPLPLSFPRMSCPTTNPNESVYTYLSNVAASPLAFLHPSFLSCLPSLFAGTRKSSAKDVAIEKCYFPPRLSLNDMKQERLSTWIPRVRHSKPYHEIVFLLHLHLCLLLLLSPRHPSSTRKFRRGRAHISVCSSSRVSLSLLPPHVARSISCPLLPLSPFSLGSIRDMGGF